nr:MAG TPA: hypothetical protein [Caudoviricetes sp.]
MVPGVPYLETIKFSEEPIDIPLIVDTLGLVQIILYILP